MDWIANLFDGTVANKTLSYSKGENYITWNRANFEISKDQSLNKYKSKEAACNHEWINVSCFQIKMICKHCNIDMPKRN